MQFVETYVFLYQESSFSSLEQAFAEARRRSLAQAGDKKPAPAAKPVVEASAVAGTKVAEPAASKVWSPYMFHRLCYVFFCPLFGKSWS